MGRWFMLFLMLVGVAVLVAFTLQNSAYRSPLQLDLYVAAWRLEKPASVPVLIWTSFGAGFLLSGMWGMWRAAALSRKVRRLEQDLAMTERPKDGWSG